MRAPELHQVLDVYGSAGKLPSGMPVDCCDEFVAEGKPSSLNHCLDLIAAQRFNLNHQEPTWRASIALSFRFGTQAKSGKKFLTVDFWAPLTDSRADEEARPVEGTRSDGMPDLVEGSMKVTLALKLGFVH